MAYDPHRDECASCLHFTASPDDEEIGECHRFPPSYIARIHLWDFATVTANNTCGEHVSIISDDHATSSHSH